MDIQQVLKLPKGEIAFQYMPGARAGRFPGFKRLPVERRGLRKWQSFQERPPFLQDVMKLPAGVSTDWRPWIRESDRFAMVQLLNESLIGRVEIALNAVDQGMAMRITQCLGSDAERMWVSKSSITTWDSSAWDIVTLGHIKVKPAPIELDVTEILPGTTACRESWLACPAQRCMDLDIPFGFLITNVELILFHLIGPEPPSTGATRAQSPNASEPHDQDGQTPGHVQEPDYSLPARSSHDWLRFDDGDAEIPSINVAAIPRTPQHPPPECGSDDAADVESPPQVKSESYIGMQEVSYVLIRSYPLENKAESEDGPEVALRLFEFIMFAKKVRDQGLLKIEAHKYVSVEPNEIV